MSGYILQTDSTQISSITSMRVMVSAALLYTFTVPPNSHRSTTSSSPSRTYLVAKSRWNACTITAEDWSSTGWQVTPPSHSVTQYKLPELRHLPRDPRMDHAHLRTDPPRDGPHCRNQVEHAKYGHHNLLHPYLHLVFRHPLLLHVQCPQLNIHTDLYLLVTTNLHY